MAGGEAFGGLLHDKENDGTVCRLVLTKSIRPEEFESESEIYESRKGATKLALDIAFRSFEGTRRIRPEAERY